MDSTININLVPKDEIKVFYGTEAHIDNKASVLFIKSGEAEIQKYVDEVSKPEISDYVETEAKPLVTQIVNEIAEPTVAEYIETTVKPEIDEYVEDKKPELQAYVTQASNYADNSQASATASAGSAAAALTSANNAATSETNAKTYENNALSSKNAAASSATSASNYANNSKIWAEGTDSQVQALGGEKSAKGWAEASTNLDYTNITNCITAIPQDIKLELSNGTLTLKAGSQPRDGKGNVINVTNDKTYIYNDVVNELFAVIEKNTLNVYLIYSQYITSGDTAPTIPAVGRQLWYDTTNKIVKMYAPNATDFTEASLPIAIVNSIGESKFTLDQVFNGFGYIGSTIFALPNVEGLIPNRRNTDGSFNNTKFTTTSLLTSTNGGSSDTRNILLRADSLGHPTNSYYIESENINTSTDVGLGKQDNRVIVATVTFSTGRITSFKPKTTFNATDYYDFKQLDDSAAKLDEDNVFTGYNTLNNATPILYGKNTADLTNANGMGLSLRGTDNAGNLWSYIDLYRRGESKNSEAHLYARNAGGAIAQIAVAINDDGIVTTSAPTPVIGSNSQSIATTAFVNSFFNTAGRVTDKCVPNYSAGISISESSYTAPKDGIIIIQTSNTDLNFPVLKTNSGVLLACPPKYGIVSASVYKNLAITIENRDKASSVVYYPFKGA